MAILQLLHFVIHRAFTVAKRAKLAITIVNDANGRGKAKRSRAAADH